MIVSCGNVQRFLLELGVGFAFVGRQHRLDVEDENYYLDLLFYHLKLRCFVVIDLKMRAFRPEDAGKALATAHGRDRVPRARWQTIIRLPVLPTTQQVCPPCLPIRSETDLPR